MNVQALIAEAAQYETIMKTYRETGKKFEDLNFHPKKHMEADEQYLQNAEWVRIDERLKSPLFENIYEDGIKQGGLGDCYLIAALGSMGQYPENVRLLFHEDTDVKSGCVIVYFHAFAR